MTDHDARGRSASPRPRLRARPMTSETAAGMRKTFDAGAPIVAFLAGYSVWTTAAGALAAAATGLLIASYRLLRGHQIRLVAVSLGIVLIHALVAYHTAEGRDFFLPDLLMNGVFAVVFSGSLLAGRPLSGLLGRWSGLEERRWHRDPRRMRLHRRLTALWLALWCAHLALWLPLYAADAVVALGVASVVTGKPAVVVCAVLSWRLVRRGRAGAVDSSAGSGPSPSPSPSASPSPSSSLSP